MLIHETQIMDDPKIALLIKTIYTKYGYDFSDYAEASLKRRINRIMLHFKIFDFEELLEKITQNDVFFNIFLEEITVNVTDMFRDPAFFSVLRNYVLPELASYPIIRIWHAGCSTGEEVYATAIILKELGLLNRSLLYATDINLHVLEVASNGSYSIDLMKTFNENYLASGGLFKLSDYYLVNAGKAVFNDDLRSRMVFSPHNLVIDQSFNEFNLILCRNVMIYFNRTLQDRVLQLFNHSLSSLGFLALGTKETINFTSIENDFQEISRQQKVWRKKV
jgi:chemotaxis protein methyltransferase CheR